MRESSYNFSTQNSQQPKDIRGGEKKVMKKSLSAILSLAMAFSMFSSVALGADAKKSSADFTDLKDLDAATKAKFDEMIGAGIFDGVKEGTFGLKDKMNRAQFAKVAALVFNLKVDTSLKTSSFSDVKSDDPANGYALPYIEAVKAAGITDGYAPGQFNPAGDVTKEQLATFLIRGLNKDSEGKNKTGVSDKTVSDWAKGYVALALELKLLSNGTDGTFGGTSAATRDLLVTSSYEAKQQYANSNKPAKASIKEAKAVDYNKVQVTLDRDVDTAKATVSLKKGTADVATDLKWSDDKKVATLTLKDGTKITEGTYSVTLGGLDASAVDKTTAEFKAENERLEKIEFVTANDTVAKSKKVRVQFKPTNQYGQNVSFPAGNFTVNATVPNNSASLTKDVDTGKFYVVMNTDDSGLISNNSQISVNIWDNDTKKSAVKVFKVGDFPYLAKVELGDVKYPTGKSALQSSGDKAVVKLTQYDQYGGELTIDSGTASNKIADPSAYITPKGNVPYESNLKYEFNDENGDGVKDLVVKLDGKVTSTGVFTVSVFGGGSTATADIKLSASKIAAKVELGEFSGSLAVGDKDKYIELIGYDAEGNKLSADDIVDNVKDKRFNISVSGPVNFGKSDNVPASMLDADGKVVITGDQKGKIHISEVTAKGNGQIYVNVFTNGVNSQASKSFSTVDARYPSTIKTITDATTKAVAGGETKPKFQLIDNYNELIKEFDKPINENNSNGTVTYDVYATVIGDSNFKVSVDGYGQLPTNGGASLTVKQFSDKEVKIETANVATGKEVEVKFALRKKKTDGTIIDSSVASVTKKVQVVDGASENLKYNLNDLGSIFNTLDDGMYKDVVGVQSNPVTSKLAKELVVEATDSAGNKVAFPKQIKSVTSEVYEYVRYGVDGGKAYVIGKKTGTSNVTVRFKDGKGNDNTVTGQVTVKNEPNKVESIEAGKSSKTFSRSGANTTADKLSDALVNGNYKVYKLMGDLTVKNQYGNEFKNEKIADYNDKLLQLDYIITDVAMNNNGTVSLDGENVTINGTGSFTLKVTAPNGKSATTTIVITD
ncbi:S-layer homology domain-containing protein [Paenibacillus elgii]|uniref:S-layer homology domain-containing protein n=1 Tax=Paenibacillus elgii TaxID=189691 RepID=UPI000FDCAFA7|nr:S-layer homology domain-containing protein [Paenibacillus elgii]NEN85124.1 S-layer homology domain-containing protein [Paenibacillus elgii]